jgi:HrpA-like RNA helicase
MDSNAQNGIPCCIKKLPMWQKVSEIRANIVKKEPCALVAGTGTGKTVVVVSVIATEYEELGITGMVYHAVPTRTAAETLSGYVSSQISNGKKWVGKAHSGNKEYGEETRIALCTYRHVYNMLLNTYKYNPNSLNNTLVVIDEAHDKSIECYQLQLLIHWLRSVQAIRMNIIVLTATPISTPIIDLMMFIPKIELNLKTYPVSIYYEPYVPSNEGEYWNLVRDRIIQAASELNMGENCIVFCSGEKQIENLMNLLANLLTKEPYNVVTYFSQMSTEELDAVHERHNCKQIILATNILESAVTVHMVTRIVDLCLEKVPTVSGRTTILSERQASKNSLAQRAGRTGRMCEGVIYRIITEHDYLRLSTSSESQFTNMRIEIPILELLGRSLPADEIFRIDQGSYEQIISKLTKLGLVDKNNELTETARQVIKYPVCLQNATVIHNTAHHKCDSCTKNRCEKCKMIAILTCAVIALHEVTGGASSVFYYPKKGDTVNDMTCFRRFGGKDDLDIHLNVFLLMAREVGRNGFTEKNFKKWAFENQMNSKTLWNSRIVFHKLINIVFGVHLSNTFETIFGSNESNKTVSWFSWKFFKNQKLNGQVGDGIRTLIYTGYSDLFLNPEVIVPNIAPPFLQYSHPDTHSNYRVQTKGVCPSISSLNDYLPQLMAMSMATIHGQSGKTSKFIAWLIEVPQHIIKKIKEDEQAEAEERKKRWEEDNKKYLDEQHEREKIYQESQAICKAAAEKKKQEALEKKKIDDAKIAQKNAGIDAIFPGLTFV